MSNDSNETSIVRPGANGAGAAIQRAGFGSTEMEQRRETQGTALAERAKAETQARYIMAIQRPRNMGDVRSRLLDHCKRPRFAAVVDYAKPVGGSRINGASVRFVETALQEYGNVMPDATVVYDDDEKRVVRVSLTDLERNITYSEDAIAEKFVERRTPKTGDEVIGSRINSQGQQVHRVRATEDDFANKMAAAVSKKLRNLGLRILPADIVDEAREIAKATRANEDAVDPAAARKRIADAFAELRVMPSDVDLYLGHSLDTASPAEMDELRAAYAAVKDGEARWIDLVDVKKVERGEVEEPSKATAAAGNALKTKLEDAKAKRAAKSAATVAVAPDQDGES